ncbi:hypothetical protein [Marinospirillum insulare]|uniref:Lipoprotein n=1 Tax=Marinospirillum insulare TaxID=217169 RepID=A0ABQ5ZW30_9GAMM|nr:hypothetical protein [Marinospirillum insulare]GLR64374.1 hypothetical protein GCM10007878_18120 [Marinospirillum insulare]
MKKIALKIRIAIAIGFTVLLAACNSSSSSGSSDETSNQQPPQVVTEANIASFMHLEGDGIEQVSGVAYEESNKNDVPSFSLSEEVRVSSGSVFPLRLQAAPPAGEQVAGFLIELPGGEQHFVQAADRAEVAMISSVQLDESHPKFKAYAELEKKQVSIASTEAPNVREAVVRINGWSSEGILEEDIRDLFIRVMPLFVNTRVANVADLSFNQLLDRGGSFGNYDEIKLVVEAVAASTIQVTLTWDGVNDVDLYVLEPGWENSNTAGMGIFSEKIYYANRISSESLGWLDKDNVIQYGPENITFAYKMLEGDYDVAVNFFANGRYDEATNYFLTVNVEGQDSQFYEGKFNPTARNGGSFRDNDVSDCRVGAVNAVEQCDPARGTHIIHTIKVDENLNAKLANRLPIEDYMGSWEYTDTESDVTGCLVIDGEFDFLTLDYLPTGFKLENGTLKVSDAFLANTIFYGSGRDYNYKFHDLTRVEACSN